jgi:hypothetical protein
MSVKIKTFLDGAGKASDFPLTDTGLFENVKKSFCEKFGKSLIFKYKKGDGTLIDVVDDKSIDLAHKDMLKTAAAFLRLEGSLEGSAESSAPSQPVQPVQPTQPVQPSETPQRFCTECGHKLSGGKFCTECGHQVGATAPPASKDSPKSTPVKQTVKEPVKEPVKQPTKEPVKEPAKPEAKPEPAKEKPKESEGKAVEPIHINKEVICAGCEKPVVTGVKVLEKYWHSYCFKCHKCSAPIGKGKIFESAGHPFCEKCYCEDHAPKCKKCSKPIIGEYVTVKDEDYHDACFVCTECKDKIVSAYSMDQKGNILCTRCSNKRKGISQ